MLVQTRVGGTTPPQSDSSEISRVLVLNLLWQSKRCSRTAQETPVLDNAFALIEGHPACRGSNFLRCPTAPGAKLKATVFFRNWPKQEGLLSPLAPKREKWRKNSGVNVQPRVVPLTGS